MKRLLLSFLGSFQVHLDNEDISGAFRTKKERALLAYLISEPNRQHHREILGELFWPERPEGYARTNLRQALSGIRRAIADRGTQVPFFFISDEYIQFNRASPHFLDTQEFDRLIDFTNRHAHHRIESCPVCAEKLESAINIYRGDFLDEFLLVDSNAFQEWIMFQREHYFRQLLIALQKLIEYYKLQGEYKTAQKYAWRQVSLAPLEENAYRQLMILLVMDGRRSAALEQYQVCRQVLATELGVDPDIETTALYEKIKAGFSFELPPATAQPTRTNLPAQFTTFVGRDAELEWMDDCLSNPICRLVTITGMSGVGKTRLAIQAGRQYLYYFPDGVWFVPLQAVSSIDLIAPSIAQALELKPEQRDAQIILTEYLSQRKALLIIDNFEQLIQGTGILLDLLKTAPQLKLMVTTQQRLSYQATCNLELRGLPYPTGPVSMEAAQGYAAIQLFLARANRIYSGFQLAGSDMAHVIRICQLVDGLPLGIELAAASLRHRNCEQVAQVLGSNLDVLATTLLDIPERHRSLRAAFDHSWEMLTHAERDTYRRLSIFHGEFNLDTAIQTTGTTLAVIASLVDKSLLQTNSAGQYLIQPLLRQYAAEKLADSFTDNEPAIPDFSDPHTAQTRDPVTALPNGLLFRDLCQYALARAQRSQKYVVLLLLEIGQTAAWKQINGQAHGSRFLIDFTEQLCAAIRGSDAVARLSLTKFAILLEDVNKSNAGEVVLNKVLTRLEATSLFSASDLNNNLRTSSSLFPDDGDQVSTLLQIANHGIQTGHRPEQEA